MPKIQYNEMLTFTPKNLLNSQDFNKSLSFKSGITSTTATGNWSNANSSQLNQNKNGNQPGVVINYQSPKNIRQQALYNEAAKDERLYTSKNTNLPYQDIQGIQNEMNPKNEENEVICQLIESFVYNYFRCLLKEGIAMNMFQNLN